MIDLYLNQTVTLKTKGAVNEYNEPTYTTSNIKVRFEYKRRMVRNNLGQEVVSEARCFTTTEVNEDDIITFDGKDWNVLAVEDCVGLEGTISHYEVSM